MKSAPLGTARNSESIGTFRYATTAPCIETLLDVDALALSDPAQYRELLDAFFLILGQRRLWWARCAEAEDPTWQASVRAAIVAVAAPSGWSSASIADLLDLEDAFPKTKERVLRLAREHFYRRAVAS